MKFLFYFVLVCVIHKGQFSQDTIDYDDLFNGVDFSTSVKNLNENQDRTTNTETTENYRTTTRKSSQPTTTFPAPTESAIEKWEDLRCKQDEKCVPYYLCKEDNNINSDGSFLIDERFDGFLEEDIIGNYCPSLEICCKRVDYIEPGFQKNETSKDVKKPEDSEVAIDISDFQPLPITPAAPVTQEPETEGISQCENPAFSTPEKCGFHNPKGLGGLAKSKQNKINYAQYAEFPWMMAVLREIDDKKVKKYQCGGSLINPRVVLTSAHNIYGIDPKNFIVRGGEWNTETDSELCGHVERKVKKAVKHENFSMRTLNNDIALLILEEGFEMTPFINTVCLPPKNSDFDHKRCFSAGWGKNSFGKEGVYQAFLKKVELPIVSHHRCQTKLRKTKLGDSYELFEKNLCAGGEEGIDVCTGDGGSPLMCEIESYPGHYEQAGIVSFGVGCGQKDVPGFYVDVSKYRDWIDAVINDNV